MGRPSLSAWIFGLFAWPLTGAAARAEFDHLIGVTMTKRFE